MSDQKSDRRPFSLSSRGFGHKAWAPPLHAAPHPSTVALTPTTAVVSNEMPKRVRRLFPFETFNAMQSQCLEAWTGDESMVVTAPTGAGKTAVFDMAALRAVFLGSGSANRVVVYLGPTKALVRERVRAWEAGFGGGVARVVEVSSDTAQGGFGFQERLREGLGEEVPILVVATPEKWEVFTRRTSRVARDILARVVLVLLDEAHLVGEEGRGHALEVAVTRMKVAGGTGSGGTGIRFVAASATIPNGREVAAWLNVPDTHLKTFSMAYRPIPLDLEVLGFPDNKKNGFMFERSLTSEVADTLTQYAQRGPVSAGGGFLPVLIFCSSRAGTSATAKYLATGQKALAPRLVFGSGPRGNARRRACAVASEKVSTAELASALRAGLGFHNAGLTPGDRRVVETLFRNSDLPVLCTTTTLALGVNLPAATVVIKSTQRYVGGGYDEYSKLDVLQMIGRAGRPGFATSGEAATAVILTSNAKVAKYRSMGMGNTALTSVLEARLPEALNAAIVRGTVTDNESAVAWLAATFLYTTQREQETWASMTLNSALTALLDSGLILQQHQEQEERGYVATPAGRFMSAYMIRFGSMVLFANLPPDADVGKVLRTLAEAEELGSVVVRQKEKKKLGELNKTRAGNDKGTLPLPHPLVIYKTKRPTRVRAIKTPAEKIYVLWQAELAGIPIGLPSLTQEARWIAREGERLSRALVQSLIQTLGEQPHQYAAVKSALLVAKSFKASLWHDTELETKQLDRIGIHLARKLAEAGVGTLRRVAEADAGTLEAVCTRRPPFGVKLRTAAQELIESQTIELDVRLTVLTSGSEVGGVEASISASWLGYSETRKTSVLVGVVETNDILFLNPFSGVGLDTRVVFPPKSTLEVCVISHEVVGCDVVREFRVPGQRKRCREGVGGGGGGGKKSKVGMKTMP